MILPQDYATSDLPREWNWRALKDVTVRPATVDPRKSPEARFKYIDISAIDNSHSTITSARELMGEDAPTRARQLVKAKDTLYSTVRVYLKNLAQVPVDLDGAIASTGFCVLRPNNLLDPDFLFHWVQTTVFTSVAAGMQRGISYPAVNESDLLNIAIPLPPLDHQRAVVLAIDKQFSRLDAGIRSLAMAAKRLSQLRQLILDTLVGGIADSSRLRTGWALKPLGQLLVEIDAGKSFKCEERPARADEWGVIKVSAMTWGEFDERENKTITTPERINPIYEIRPGDLLLSRANTVEYVGAAVYVQRCRPHLLLSDKSMRLRPSAAADPRWLRLALSSAYVRRQIMEKATGTIDSMRNISQAKVRQLIIPTPPREKQAEIAAEWSRLSSELDSVARTLTVNVVRSSQLRWAVLAAAFTGRLPKPAEVGHAQFVAEPQVLATMI